MPQQPDFGGIGRNLADLSRSLSPTFQMPDIEPSPLVTNVTQNYASEFHKRLVKWVNDFDAALDHNYEVGVRLVNFGQTITFHLQDLGYWNPSLISFSGATDAGDPVELIQHVSQISILLMKLPRKNPEAPKRPIGFHANGPDADANTDDPSET